MENWLESRSMRFCAVMATFCLTVFFLLSAAMTPGDKVWAWIAFGWLIAALLWALCVGIMWAFNTNEKEE